MELWIRSQDKRALLNVRQVRINGLDIMCLNGELLGTYISKERALEVLDEIQEHLDYLNIGNINRVDEKGFRVSTIYNMPEE